MQILWQDKNVECKTGATHGKKSKIKNLTLLNPISGLKGLSVFSSHS
jgi:hypothetical protein